MRLILTFGLVAAVSAGAGAAAQHLADVVAPPTVAPTTLASPAAIVPVVSRQPTTTTPARARVRMPIEANPYGPVPEADGRLGEIAGHDSGLLAPAGTVSYRRVAGPRPHIASNPYYYSDVDDGQDHPVDLTRAAMEPDSNPYAH